MTDEQIKQSAVEYASDKNYRTGNPSWWAQVDFIAGFISGANSRDGEIKRLYNSLEHFHSIINNLRNPWISVEERLPEEGRDVLICTQTGNVIRNNFMRSGDITYMKNNLECYRCWMPTPMPKSDEK